MIRYLCCLLLVLQPRFADAQILEGRAYPLSGAWRPMVYLLKIDRFQTAFNGDSRLLADSARLGPDGHFRFSRLAPSSLYRVGMIPAGETVGAMIISDGIRDNYVFVLTDDQAGVQQLDFCPDSMLWSAKFRRASLRTRAYGRLFRERLPAFRTLQHFGRIADSLGHDSAAISRLAPLAIAAIQQAFAQTDSPLARLLLKEKDALVFAAGMELYCGLDGIEKHAGLLARGHPLLENSRAPYARSLFEHITSTSSAAEKLAAIHQAYPSLTGGELRLDTIPSKLVLLDFWASWCQPCRSDFHRAIRPLSAHFRPDELTVVGVNMDTEQERALKAVTADSNQLLQVFVGTAFRSGLAKAFNVTALPAYVLYDVQNGTFYSGLPATQLLSRIEELLKSR